MKNADEFYKPEIKPNILVDGIAAETTPPNSKSKIMQEGFITSLQSDFDKIASNISQLFYSNKPINSINNYLIIIKKDNVAKIYSEFPISIKSNAKRNIQERESITKEDIFDIVELKFKNDIYEIEIENEDKIIFLFRVDWKFGLYFNFTKRINLNDLKNNLVYLYKRLFYYDLYTFVENKSYFDNLIKDGWFPFIRLIGSNFDKIMQYYKEEKKHNFQIDELINHFTKEKIESFTQN